MTNSNSKEAWAKYLATRLDGKTASSDLGPGDAEKRKTQVGHHNQAKKSLKKRVKLQGSQNLPNQ